MTFHWLARKHEWDLTILAKFMCLLPRENSHTEKIWRRNSLFNQEIIVNFLFVNLMRQWKDTQENHILFFFLPFCRTINWPYQIYLHPSYPIYSYKSVLKVTLQWSSSILLALYQVNNSLIVTCRLCTVVS